MARLMIKTAGFNNQVINLNLGVNRIGRGPGNHFIIDHITISAKHCEIALDDSGVTVRDCGSTNGTYINDQPVMQAKLAEGQVLRLGDVDLQVESADVTIAIPRFEASHPEPPGGRKKPVHKEESVGEDQKKKTLLGFLPKTVKLPFLHKGKGKE
jgi:pSer/pThr/pTyr-binding forkhead associated (FHA) protein